MPFSQTRPEICGNLEYFVAVRKTNETKLQILIKKNNFYILNFKFEKTFQKQFLKNQLLNLKGKFQIYILRKNFENFEKIFEKKN